MNSIPLTNHLELRYWIEDNRVVLSIEGIHSQLTPLRPFSLPLRMRIRDTVRHGLREIKDAAYKRRVFASDLDTEVKAALAIGGPVHEGMYTTTNEPPILPQAPPEPIGTRGIPPPPVLPPRTKFPRVDRHEEQ